MLLPPLLIVVDIRFSRCNSISIYYFINTVITMENTALNVTTNATKDHEDWKKKKGYGRIIVAVSLALLLSLYAGGYLGSGTHFRHGEMGTTNAAASSSSTALVGSGTAASDLKTLTT